MSASGGSGGAGASGGSGGASGTSGGGGGSGGAGAGGSGGSDGSAGDDASVDAATDHGLEDSKVLLDDFRWLDDEVTPGLGAIE